MIVPPGHAQLQVFEILHQDNFCLQDKLEPRPLLH
jgi:hypothetical protein